MTGMPYQRYWDDQEYREGLRAQIEEALESAGVVNANAGARAVMQEVFGRVKLQSWCPDPWDCAPGCRPTHYRFEIDTVPRQFAPAKEG